VVLERQAVESGTLSLGPGSGNVEDKAIGSDHGWAPDILKRWQRNGRPRTYV